MTAATIVRSKHNKENKYFMMRKETAQNKKLSFEARGLLCYLLSMPDDWEIQVKDLKQQCGEARIYRILDELKQAKYLKNREKYQDEKGHWQWTPYVIYELPIADTVDEKIIPMPEQVVTTPQKPQHGEPSVENREIIQNTESQNTETKTTFAPAADAPKPSVLSEKKKQAPKANPIFDWVALNCFSLEPHSPEIKRNSGRIAKIVSYLSEKQATIEQLDRFKAWYKRTMPPDYSMPVSDGKFSQYFKKFQDADKPKQVEVITAPTPKRPSVRDFVVFEKPEGKKAAGE